MEKSLKRADMVVTVSKFTRKEILNYFTYPEKRIKVIYNGFNSLPNNDCKYGNIADKFIKENNLPPSYIFYIGTLDPRKNIDRLIEAFSLCREKFKDFPDLFIGGINFQDWGKSNLKTKIEKLKLFNHIHLCGVLEKKLLIASLVLGFPI